MVNLGREYLRRVMLQYVLSASRCCRGRLKLSLAHSFALITTSPYYVQPTHYTPVYVRSFARSNLRTATHRVLNVPFIAARSSLIAAVSGNGDWAVRHWGRGVTAPSRLAAIICTGSIIWL
jgi:hypothetical protein